MSRCFPFPPPGYKKEASTFGSDLLKKEKDKEKKLKKEKKNREKKDGKDKEKKEKDRSDGKHRDKKEKKEKHRDKEEKDRDKDRDKSSTSDEKRIAKETEHINGDKASDEKKVPGKSVVNSGEIFLQKGKEKDLNRNSILDDKKFSGQFSGYNERVSQNSDFAELPKDPKIVQQLDRRIKGAGKQSAEKLIGADVRKDEELFRLVVKSAGTSADGRNDKNKRGLDSQGFKDVPRFTANAMAQTVPGMVQPQIDRTSKPLEKEGYKRVEGKEKGKQKEGDDRRGDKQKDKYEKEGHRKEKDRGKEKKNNDKAKQKSEHMKTEPDKLKERSNDGLAGINNAKTAQLPEESIKNPVGEGNLKKRKNLDTNGFLSACDIKPNKMPKPASSFPSTQNGKILGTPQNSSVVISDGRQGAVNNLKAGTKENKINGIKESLTVFVSSATQLPFVPAKPLLTTVKTDQLAEPSGKVPHSDSKYLNEVLTVPKMEEWSDFDDQEWLFQSSDSQSKRPKLGSFGIDEMPQVWSETLWIESADVYALPYVVPY